MPQKNQYQTTTHRPGLRVKKRKQGQKVIGQPGGHGAINDAIIADSVHAVRFNNKPGAEVFFAQDGNNFSDDHFTIVYKACRIAYIKATKLVRKEDTTFDPLASGLSMGVSLFSMLDGIRKMLPRGFEVNVDTIENYQAEKTVYHINIYKVCNWNFYHHYIEVGPALIRLRKANRRLHDLFLCFLNHLRHRGITIWDEGAMGNDLEMMDERILNCDFDTDKDEIEYKSCSALYKKGDAKKYAALIRKSKLLPVDEMMKRANRYSPKKKENVIANVIYQGCHLLMEKHTIREFATYLPHEDFQERMFLDFESTISIIWQEGDGLACDHASSLDALANEGVQEPIIFVTLDKNTQELDFDKMEKKAHWLTQLGDFFQRADKLIKQYK